MSLIGPWPSVALEAVVAVSLKYIGKNDENTCETRPSIQNCFTNVLMAI